MPDSRDNRRLFKISDRRYHQVNCSQGCNTGTRQSVCWVWRTTSRKERQWPAISERWLPDICQASRFQTSNNYSLLALIERRVWTIHETRRKLHQSRYSRRTFLQTQSWFILTELSCHTTCNNRCQPWRLHCSEDPSAHACRRWA